MVMPPVDVKLRPSIIFRVTKSHTGLELCVHGHQGQSLEMHGPCRLSSMISESFLLVQCRIGIRRHLPESSRGAHLRRNCERKRENANIGGAALHKLCRLRDVFSVHQPRCDLIVDIECFQRRHCCATVRCVLRIGDRNLANRRFQQCFDPELIEIERGKPDAASLW